MDVVVNISAHCNNCVFSKRVGSELFYRCGQGKRKGEWTALCELFVCRYWRPSLKLMDVWMARQAKNKNGVKSK